MIMSTYDYEPNIKCFILHYKFEKENRKAKINPHMKGFECYLILNIFQ